MIEVLGSSKNITVHYNGLVPAPGKVVVLDVQAYEGGKGFRLDTIAYALTSGAMAKLYWGGLDCEDHFILPLEARGKMDLGVGMSSPKEQWAGTLLVEITGGPFLVSLDLDRQ